MTARWFALFLISMLITAVALALTATARSEPHHYGTPNIWFAADAPAAKKLTILRYRLKHSNDVLRFFSNHPRPARSLRGRDVSWQHKKLRAWALRRIRDVRHELWLELPEVNDWVTAVRIAQRPFPGSASWLLSCSSAESSHGAWVTYGSHPYRAGVEHTGIVGGWLQYRWPTFRGHYRHALDDLGARGFRVPRSLRDAQDVRAWLSPLGQALAGGWGILHGQRSHWSASIGRGC